METNNDFLCNGIIEFVSDKIIICNNSDGTILIFDGTGKALKHINRKGPGPEEYPNVSQILYDAEREELYVNDLLSRKMVVYDMDGNYKRHFGYLKGANYEDIYSFNKNSLLCHNIGFSNYANYSAPYVLISKEDGKKIKDIDIYIKKKMDIGIQLEGHYFSALTRTVVKSDDGLILSEYGSDTIFNLNQDAIIKPIISRVPSVVNVDIPIFLEVVLETNHYLFLATIKKEVNLQEKTGYRQVEFMYEKLTGRIFEQVIYNEDYVDSEKRNIDMIFTRRDYVYRQMQAFRLKQDYEKGKLKGKLKKIAENLNEDDNPIIMILKFKE